MICVRPELGSLVAVARTATIRAAHPGQGARGGSTAIDYYAYIDQGPKPCVTVIQDLDGPQRAYGSFWGEVNSKRSQGFGLPRLSSPTAACATSRTSPKASKCWPTAWGHPMPTSM